MNSFIRSDGYQYAGRWKFVRAMVGNVTAPQSGLKDLRGEAVKCAISPTVPSKTKYVLFISDILS